MMMRLLTHAALLAVFLLGGCAEFTTPTETSPAVTANAWYPSPRTALTPLAQSIVGTPPRSTMAAAAPAVAAESPPLTAIDPLRPAVPVDLEAADARTDLWARIRTGYSIAEIDNDLVRKWEQWYSSRPDYVQRMTERGSRFLFHIAEELARRGMPADLALLPFVESAYNPQAQSVAKAVGMWQFVASTGRDFSLRQNVFRDDRRDVLASTRAALDYLQTLYAQFNDWQLALAAYNWGQGNVARAVARSQQAGLPGRYDDLRMPDETRNYLPKLQAVKNIVARPADFGLALPVLGNHPYFVSVAIARDIDVDLAARLAGLSIEAFRQLNPQLNKPVILAAGTPQVLLPYDSANIFVRAVANHAGPLASWTAWVAPRTLKPAEAARLVGMDERELREVNAIPSGMLIRTRSTLLVPRDPQRPHDVAAEVAEGATLALAPEPPQVRPVQFKAGPRGESVAAVARRWRVPAAQVAAWNGVAQNAMFRPGQVIVVMKTAAKAAVRVAAAKPQTRSAPRRSASAVHHGGRPSVPARGRVVALRD